MAFGVEEAESPNSAGEIDILFDFYTISQFGDSLLICVIPWVCMETSFSLV